MRWARAARQRAEDATHRPSASVQAADPNAILDNLMARGSVNPTLPCALQKKTSVKTMWEIWGGALG